MNKGLSPYYNSPMPGTHQDVETKILLRIRVYDRDGRLIENYGYENLDLDAHLSDADFDPKNLDYDF